MTELGVLKFEVRFSRAARNWSARLQSEANQRQHWGSKAARVKLQRKIVARRWDVETRLSRPPLRPRLPALVALTRIAPGKLDTDNTIRSLKAVRDQVAEQLGVDDDDPRLKWSYNQRRSEPGVWGLVVEVTWHMTGSRWVTWDQAPDIEVVRSHVQQELPIAAHGCAEEVA